MFARVRIDSEEPREVLMIPRTAIQFNPFGNIVFILVEEDDELVVQQRLVRTGQSRGDMVEILKGLELGDRVASSGLLKLRNGSVVKISDDPDLQPSASTNPAQPAKSLSEVGVMKFTDIFIRKPVLATVISPTDFAHRYSCSAGFERSVSFLKYAMLL